MMMDDGHQQHHHQHHQHQHHSMMHSHELPVEADRGGVDGEYERDDVGYGEGRHVFYEPWSSPLCICCQCRDPTGGASPLFPNLCPYACCCPCYLYGKTISILHHEVDFNDPATQNCCTPNIGRRGCRACLCSALANFCLPIPCTPLSSLITCTSRHQIVKLHRIRDHGCHPWLDVCRGFCCAPLALYQHHAYLHKARLDNTLRHLWELDIPTSVTAKRQTSSNYTQNFKLLILGANGVGKTSVFNRLLGKPVGDEEMAQRSSHEVAIGIRKAVLEERGIVFLEIWDVPFQSETDLSAVICSNADGMILVFDHTKAETFYAATTLYADVMAVTNGIEWENFQRRQSARGKMMQREETTRFSMSETQRPIVQAPGTIEEGSEDEEDDNDAAVGRVAAAAAAAVAAATAADQEEGDEKQEEQDNPSDPPMKHFAHYRQGQSFAVKRGHKVKNIPCVLLANMTDLAVPPSKHHSAERLAQGVQDWVQHMGIPLLNVCATEGVGINKAMRQILHQMCHERDTQMSVFDQGVERVTHDPVPSSQSPPRHQQPPEAQRLIPSGSLHTTTSPESSLSNLQGSGRRPRSANRVHPGDAL